MNSFLQTLLIVGVVVGTSVLAYFAVTSPIESAQKEADLPSPIVLEAAKLEDGNLVLYLRNMGRKVEKVGEIFVKTDRGMEVFETNALLRPGAVTVVKVPVNAPVEGVQVNGQFFPAKIDVTPIYIDISPEICEGEHPLTVRVEAVPPFEYRLEMDGNTAEEGVAENNTLGFALYFEPGAHTVCFAVGESKVCKTVQTREKGRLVGVFLDHGLSLEGYEDRLFWGDYNRVRLRLLWDVDCEGEASVVLRGPCINDVSKNVALVPPQTEAILETNTTATGPCTIEVNVDGNVITFSKYVSFFNTCQDCTSCNNALASLSEENSVVVLTADVTGVAPCIDLSGALPAGTIFDLNGHTISSDGATILLNGVQNLKIRNGTVLAPEGTTTKSIQPQYDSRDIVLEDVNAYLAIPLYNSTLLFDNVGQFFYFDSGDPYFPASIHIYPPCPKPSEPVHLRVFLCKTAAGETNALTVFWSVSDGVNTISEGNKYLGHVSVEGCRLIDIPEANFLFPESGKVVMIVYFRDNNTGVDHFANRALTEVVGSWYKYATKRIVTDATCTFNVYTSETSLRAIESYNCYGWLYGGYTCLEPGRYSVYWKDSWTYSSSYASGPNIYVFWANDMVAFLPEHETRALDVMLFHHRGSNGSYSYEGSFLIDLNWDRTVIGVYPLDGWEASHNQEVNIVVRPA